MNSKTVLSVERGSPAHKAGVRRGDLLLAIGGMPVRDVLDYKFYSYDAHVELELERGGERICICVDKPEGEDLGLDFGDYLMDSQHGCSNRCIFCFVDQLPRGMRKTLYFKDDDMRLSFLMGNYISLTGLGDEDARRIARLRISPLNISVHTTDPKLRELMLGNPRAGESLKYLRDFAAAGITINAQIVVCPGINDGEALARTLRDLSALAPAVQSIAVVPVGLTRHRQELYALRPVDSGCARAIIEAVDSMRRDNIKAGAGPLCFCADEMYLKARLPLPEFEYYRDFDQLENGVGLMRLFERELKSELALEDDMPSPTQFGVVTGAAAAPFMCAMVDLIAQKCNNIEYSVYGIDNDFFGRTIDVSGLVTGGDIISQLKGRKLPQRLILPKSMLRHGETVFLDDVGVDDVERELNVRVQAVEVDGGDFLDTVLEV